MEFTPPSRLDDIINASDNMPPQPADIMLPPILEYILQKVVIFGEIINKLQLQLVTQIPQKVTVLRDIISRLQLEIVTQIPQKVTVLREVTNKLQLVLEDFASQSPLVYILFAIIASVILGTLLSWIFGIVLYTIRITIRIVLFCVSAMSWSSTPSTSPKMAESPVSTRHGDAHAPTTPPTMQSDEVVLPQPHGDSNNRGSGQSKNSNTPLPDAVVVTHHIIHKYQDQKDMMQREGGRYHKSTYSTPGGGVQVHLFDQAKMYVYPSDNNMKDMKDMAWVIIGAAVMAIIIAFLIKA
ncbi:hypothetical protein F4810DRAFT_707191 [Camillea tinctor]|nr:hypothetical protein F4810DRAFT_707191 [Camillea tinctor]